MLCFALLYELHDFTLHSLNTFTLLYCPNRSKLTSLRLIWHSAFVLQNSVSRHQKGLIYIICIYIPPRPKDMENTIKKVSYEAVH